jgi:hypothetical protein
VNTPRRVSLDHFMHPRGPRTPDSLADKIACVLLPRGLGRDAWRFRAFRSAATFMDAWSLFCIVVIHSLGLAKAKRLYQLPSYLLPGVIQIVVALLQYAWWKYKPDHYFRHRPFIQLGNRCAHARLWRMHRKSHPCVHS